MHASNYGHNGVPSVSGNAATLHKQGSRIHPGVLSVLAAESRRVTTDMGGYTRIERTGHLANSNNAGKSSSRT